MKPRIGLLRHLLLVFPFATPLLIPPMIADAGPPLEIQASGTNQVRLQWTPDQNINVLESSSTLGVGEPWRAVGQPPEIVGPKLQVTPPPGGSKQFFRLATRGLPGSGGNPGTLPDPTGTATPPPPNALEDFATSIAFLYTGNDGVQLGMPAGTIQQQRASVLRGKVKKRDGSPLAGVLVAIHNFPQFGYTYTRTNGMFDLAVNGGPLYTVDYQAVGYCPAQRQAQAPAQDFRCVEDVIMIGMDPIATPVSFGPAAPLQVARSTVNTDQAGSRSATILFPPGTCANLIMPDGSTPACNGLTIRATEFTVGLNGPEAMPGPLPPSSAYTYAVELSGDEAVAAGARSIQFNQFVHVYVDNFLGLPTGALVPSGYYDREISAWVPQENGVVIRILNIAGGIAQVDVNGDGVAEDSAALDAGAFTTGELQHLAASYAVNKTLWRMPAKHFTPVDYNCAANMENRGKGKPGDKAKGDSCDKSGGGGQINLSSQIFEETIPLTGVPAGLHYSSARVPGYRVDAELHLPLVGDTVFPDLVKVRVDMDIAGRLNEFEFPPVANQTEDFGWDGYDAYGRLVNDTRRARFNLIYFYPQIYGGHELMADRGIAAIGYGPPLFGNYSQFTSVIGHQGINEVASVQFERLLTVPDHRKQGLGGWSLTPHHRYDPLGKILYLGDGTVQRPESLVNGVSVVEVTAVNEQWRHVAAASDGSLFLTNTAGRVFRMTSAGVPVSITAGQTGPGIIAVRGDELYRTDGMPAAQVFFSPVGWNYIAVGPDDSLYLRTTHEIIRITPAGIIKLVLGGGPYSDPPDGSFARQAQAAGESGTAMAVGPDHTVYYSDGWNLAGGTHYFIRKISTDGRIYTLAGRAGAGGGPFNPRFEGFGGPAALCKTAQISDLAVAPNGSLYATAAFSLTPIVRITAGGTLELVASGGASTRVGIPGSDYEISEGKPAVSSTGGGNIEFIKVAPDGSVYFRQNLGSGGAANVDTIWKIDPAGLFQRVAGKWFAPYEPGLNPLQASMGNIYDFTLDREGALTALTQVSFSSGPYSLRRIGPAFPGFDVAELTVAARDGSELYVFNAKGLHLRTVNTLTGATEWLFTYDSSNLVTQMRDRDGLFITIERAANGTPLAIVGPYGQRTTLAVNASGFLTGVTNPAGEAATLAYGTAGLLTSITGPRGNTFSVSYDAKGRANQMADPAGGAITVSHSYVSTDYSTTITTAGGGTSGRMLNLASNGDSQIISTNSDNTTDLQVRTVTGGVVSTSADGTVTTIKETGDPRFPGQTSVPESLLLAFPGGLKPSFSFNRSAVLANAGDPFSFTSLTTSVNLNGQVFSSQYDAVTRRFTATTPTGRQQTADIDAAGRVIRRQFAEPPLTNSYDAFGRLATVSDGPATDLRIRTLSYNTNGQLSQITSPLGRTVQLAYDSARRPQQFTLPGGALVAFEHDAENNLTGVTPPGRPKHQFQYNSVGSLTKYSPPVAATDDSIVFAYDLDRNLTNIALPDGQNWALLRGPGGRARQWKLGAGPDIDFSYNATTGQLTSMVSSTGEGITFGYQGSLPVLTRWTGIITGEVTLQFDANLAIASQSINGASVAFAYDNDGLLTQAGGMAITRDAASGRVSGNSMGAVSESYAYNELGLLTSQTVTVSGSNVVTVQLTYDRLNRITDKTETVSGVSREFHYAYDSGGRLSEVQKDGAVLATYTYDTNGNRLTRNAEAATYDVQDRLTSYAGATFGWSRNGYRTSRTAGGQTTAFNYDIRGALKSVTLPGQQIDYVLDPLGRRIGRKTGGVLERGWLWQGNQVVAELNANSVVTRRFIYETDQITPAIMIVGTNSYRILADERGSVRLVVNTADGTVAQALDYDEFGRVLADTAPRFQPFGYAGGLYDPDTGLVEFGERDYDAQSGQWTARDPIDFLGGQFSLYAYVSNDPVNQIDPSGTGPFLGFLDRNRQRAIDAAFDTTPGNNERFENALDRYDRSVQAAVITGQVLVNTGQLLNTIAPGPRGPRAGIGGSGLRQGAARLGRGTGLRGRAAIGRIYAPRAASRGPGLPGGPAPTQFSYPAHFNNGFSPQTMDKALDFIQEGPHGCVIFH